MAEIQVAALPTGRLVKLERMNVREYRAARAAAAKLATGGIDLWDVYLPDEEIKRTLVGITNAPVQWVEEKDSGFADLTAMRKLADEQGLWVPLNWQLLSESRDGKTGEHHLDNVVSVDEYDELRRLMQKLYAADEAARKKLGEGRLVEIMS